MSRNASDRRLTTREIDVLIHLLRVGGAHMPVTLLSGARELAVSLARLGLLNIWHRQSITRGRPEGPFYSLTRDGALRAESLILSRQARPNGITPTYRELFSDESTPPVT